MAIAPVEPLVRAPTRAPCIQVTLRNNRLPAVAPDLAGWQDMMWVSARSESEIQVTGLPEMPLFNNNLIRPSSHVGLHAQLVEHDRQSPRRHGSGGNAAGGLWRPRAEPRSSLVRGDLRTTEVRAAATCAGSGRGHAGSSSAAPTCCRRTG